MPKLRFGVLIIQVYGPVLGVTYIEALYATKFPGVITPVSLSIEPQSLQELE